MEALGERLSIERNQSTVKGGARLSIRSGPSMQKVFEIGAGQGSQLRKDGTRGPS
jgi:hypothetical protein